MGKHIFIVFSVITPEIAPSIPIPFINIVLYGISYNTNNKNRCATWRHPLTALNPFHQSILIGIIRKTLSRNVIPIAKRCFSVHLKYPFCKIQRKFVICCHFLTPYFLLISCSLVHSRMMNSIIATKNVIPVQQNRMYITPENGRPR